MAIEAKLWQHADKKPFFEVTLRRKNQVITFNLSFSEAEELKKLLSS